MEYSSSPECSCDAQLRERRWCLGGSAAKEGFGGSQQPWVCSGAWFVLHCIFCCWDVNAGACKLLAISKGKSIVHSLPDPIEIPAQRVLQEEVDAAGPNPLLGL